MVLNRKHFRLLFPPPLGCLASHKAILYVFETTRRKSSAEHDKNTCPLVSMIGNVGYAASRLDFLVDRLVHDKMFIDHSVSLLLRLSIDLRFASIACLASVVD
jgi:hypothetical protein